MAAAGAALTLSPAAFADLKWTFTGSGQQVLPTQQFNGQVISGSDPATNVTVSAWADTGAGSDPNKKLYQGNAFRWDGLGVQWKSPGGGLENSASPHHAMDNCKSNVTDCSNEVTPDGDNYYPEEFLLFSFSNDVVLKEVGIGWYSYDSDISLLAWTGAGTPDLTQNSYSAGNADSLVNNGWTFVGHYSNLHDCDTFDGAASGCSATQNDAARVNTGDNSLGNGWSGNSATVISSSYWLVGAYNSRVNSTNPGWTNDNDFIKLVSLSGHVAPPPPPDIPTPAPLALMVLAGLAGPLRRRLRRSRT